VGNLVGEAELAAKGILVGMEATCLVTAEVAAAVAEPVEPVEILTLDQELTLIPVMVELD